MTNADTALGRQHELVALAGKPLADDLLGAAGRLRRWRHRVGVRRIEEGHAAFGGPVEDGEGNRFVALVSKRHCAEADFRYPQPRAPQPSDLHGFAILDFGFLISYNSVEGSPGATNRVVVAPCPSSPIENRQSKIENSKWRDTSVSTGTSISRRARTRGWRRSNSRTRPTPITTGTSASRRSATPPTALRASSTTRDALFGSSTTMRG